jgi:hypothetical protein
VLADQPEEGRAPRRQCHRVDQGERAVAGAVQQVRAQGDGAAEVMGGDEGTPLGQAPEREQLGEDPALGGEGDVLARELLRLAVAGHVPDEHLVIAGEGAGDGPPHVRREGRPVQQDHRVPVGRTEAIPVDLAGTGAGAFGELPVVGQGPSSPV